MYTRIPLILSGAENAIDDVVKAIRNKQAEAEANYSVSTKTMT